MRRLFATALVALLLGVGIVVVIQTDPGYVLVAYGHYTLEASLWVGLLLLLSVVALLFLLLRLIYRIAGGQRSLFSWLDARKARNARRLTNRGLIDFAEGNWLNARRELLRGVPNNEAPLANYLLAARASVHLQEPDKAKEYLSAASEEDHGAKVAAGIALAEMHLQSGQYQQALASLDQAVRNTSRHPYVLSLQHQAYAGLQDWEKVLELLPQMQKLKLLGAEQLQQLERDTHANNLQKMSSDRLQLQAAWQRVPKPLQRDAALLEVYVRGLVALGENDTAQTALERALQQEWQPALVRQYGFVRASDAARQLACAENWLPAHPADAQLLLCLGRLSARVKLWGKARDYFEGSYRLEHSAETCAELGRLLTALGEPSVAAAYFREGLLARENALPELPMPERLLPDNRLLAGP